MTLLAVHDARVAARRVLVVDDHPGFRAAARRLLDGPGFDVVGEAGTGEEAIGMTRDLQPDLILLDIQLPGMDGFAVAEQLAGHAGVPIIVLVSNRPRSAYRRRLDATPAAGFISKAELTREALEDLVV